MHPRERESHLEFREYTPSTALARDNLQVGKRSSSGVKPHDNIAVGFSTTNARTIPGPPSGNRSPFVSSPQTEYRSSTANLCVTVIGVGILGIDDGLPCSSWGLRPVASSVISPSSEPLASLPRHKAGTPTEGRGCVGREPLVNSVNFLVTTVGFVVAGSSRGEIMECVCTSWTRSE